MKKKFLFIFMTLFICSCTPETIETEETGIALKTKLNSKKKKKEKRKRRLNGCKKWVAPVQQPQQIGEEIDIFYDSTLVSEKEINCIRRSFFEQFCNLRMSIEQDDLDPYHDIWVIVDNLNSEECSFENPGSGGVAAKNAVQKAEEDPRVCVRNRCR